MKIRRPILRSVGDETPIAWWEWLFVPIIYPPMITVFLLLGLLSIPYFWLYPEYHRNIIDSKGTDKEKDRLYHYRIYRCKVGLWRRILEKLKVVPYDAPPEP